MPNIITKATVMIYAMAASLLAYSQNTFERVFDDFGDSEIRAAIETSDNDFIFSVTREGTIAANDLLMKVSSKGELIATLDCEIADGYLRYLGLFEHPELCDTFLAPALVCDGQAAREISIVSFDKDLKVIDEKRVVFADIIADLSPVVLPSVTVYGREIAVAAHVLLDDHSYAQFYVRMNIDGLLLYEGLDYKYNTISFFVSSISLIDEHNKHFAVLNQASFQGGHQLFVETLDSTMCVEKSQMLKYDNSGGQDYVSYCPFDTPILKSLNDTTIVANVMTDVFKSNGEIYHGNCLVSLDHNLTTTGTSLYFYDKVNTAVRLPLRSSFDIGDDCLVSCSVINWYSNHPMYKTQCLVTKYDAEMNVVWQRFVNKKEGYYYPHFVLGTEDGGSLIAGYSCDLSYQHGYSYILKTDSDGYLSINELDDLEIKPVAVYPNPCTTNVNVEVSPDVKIENVSLFDISGRLVKAQQSDFGSIDISGLAPGMYVMKVTLDDGKVFEEKIVKE
ncbi:MAG: T9SS type A sorting domain-containing protein [Bacteroidales bacterium]|nr:T9SS type A sorting domain-containing protein [Bacteroidales bacterium]